VSIIARIRTVLIASLLVPKIIGIGPTIIIPAASVFPCPLVFVRRIRRAVATTMIIPMIVKATPRVYSVSVSKLGLSSFRFENRQWLLISL
jgi:hypothetical protein